jgi:hypothetical protein
MNYSGCLLLFLLFADLSGVGSELALFFRRFEFIALGFREQAPKRGREIVLKAMR